MKGEKQMRKQWFSLLIVLVLGLGVVGCALEKGTQEFQITEDNTANKKISQSASVKSGQKENSGFGCENEEYEAFRYLKPYHVETDWKNYVLYLPKDTDHTVGNNNMEAWGTDQGVSLIFMANTDLNYYGQLDYDPFEHSLEENLGHFINILQYESTYYDSTEELEVSDIFAEGDGAAVYATFLRKMNGSYCQVFEQYYIFYDGEDYIISAVIIDGDYQTRKTKAILEEIETYLDYTIYYDEDALPEIPEETLDSDDDGFEYTQYWKISLPEGWERIADASDGYVYSPQGRTDADVIVIIDYIGEVGEGFFKTMDADELAESMGSYLTGNDSDTQLESAEVLGELPVGYTIKFVMTDGKTYSHIYMVEDGESAFMVTGIGELGDKQVEEATEYIIKHAEKK